MKAQAELLTKYRREQIKNHLTAMDALFQEIDFTHNEEGLGIFLSPGIHLLIRLSFPVTKKVFGGTSFSTGTSCSNRAILFLILYCN